MNLYHHNLLPSSFCHLFISSIQVHHYETQQASQYRPYFCKTNIAVQYPLLRTNNLEFFANFTDQLFFHINLFLMKSEKLSHWWSFCHLGSDHLLCRRGGGYNFQRGLILGRQFWKCTKCEGFRILKHRTCILCQSCQTYIIIEAIPCFPQ